MCEINNTVSFCASTGLSASPASKPVSAGVSHVALALCAADGHSVVDRRHVTVSPRQSSHDTLALCAADGSIGADWLAAGGVSPDNFKTWSGAQHGHPSALGVMTTQWTSACPPGPDTSGIPFAGEYGWNQAHTQRTSGCAEAA